MRFSRMSAYALPCIVVVLIVGIRAFGGGADEAPKAPSLEPQKWLNGTSEFSWSHLKGRLILVDRWATWCRPCVWSIPHLNKLQEAYGERGLTVVGVTDESAAKVQRFQERHPMKYPVATGVKRVYRSRSIPHAWLVSPKGKLVWGGHPGSLRASLIERALKEVVVQPRFSLPAPLAKAEKDLNEGRFGAGISSLEVYLNAPKEDGVAPAATKALSRVRKYGQSKLEEARGFATAGDYTYAVRILRDLERGFEGSAVAEQAKAQHQAWMGDEKVRAELEAEALVLEATELIKRQEFAPAAEILKRVTDTEKYADTKAQKVARRTLEKVLKRL